MSASDALRLAAGIKPESSSDVEAVVSDSRRQGVRPRSLTKTRSFLLSLLTPDSGILGQGMRFTIAGSIVTVVYLGTTTLFAKVANMPFQLALITGFSIALVVHFTLQRLFVWTHHEEFALPLHHQLGRYLTVSAAQYGLTAASVAVMPSVLGLSAEVVYLATVAVVYSVNFLVFRHGIFHADSTVPARQPIMPARRRSSER